MEKGSSSSSSSSSSAGLDSLSGLNFGKKIYFEGEGCGMQPPSPAKRGRSAVVQAVCQVEGCGADLSDAKAYYSRHKVCSMHSKTPKVIVSGLEQRFCQQCSRFHQLSEFDQGKRSCRRRLAGHNERRRKPPASSLLSTRYGSFSPSIFEDRSKFRGFVMDFSSYSSTTGRHSWPTEQVMGNQASVAVKYPIPLQSNSQNPLLLLQGPPPISSEGCFIGDPDSANALSLLSTQPWGSRTLSMSPGLSHSLCTSMAQPLSIDDGAKTIAPFVNEMPTDLGRGQASCSDGTELIGELGLAQPNEEHFHELIHSREYEASLQHMNWSL